MGGERADPETVGRGRVGVFAGRRGRLAVGALLVLGHLAFTALIFDRPPEIPDEVRFGAIALEMARDGSWLTPRLNGLPFVEKPPLMFAASGLSARTLGSADPGYLRAPQILGSMAALGVALVLGMRLGGISAGLVSALLLATTSGFLSSSTELRTDAGVMTFLAIALLATLEAWTAERPWAQLGAWVCAALALAAAVGSKGLVGGGLYAMAALGLLLASRPTPVRLFGLAFVGSAGLLAFAAWATIVGQLGDPSLLYDALLTNTWGRFAHGELGHARSPLYYLRSLPVTLLPWTLFAGAGVVHAIRALRASTRLAPERPDLGLLIGWLLGGLLLLSIASAKRKVYLLPILLPACVVAGTWLATLSPAAGEQPAATWLLRVTRWGLGCAAIICAVLAPTTGPLLLVLASSACALLIAPDCTAAWRRRTAPSLYALLAGAVWLSLCLVPSFMIERPGEIDLASERLRDATEGASSLFGFGFDERTRSVVSYALGPVRELEDVEDLGDDGPLAPESALIVAEPRIAAALDAVVRDGVPVRVIRVAIDTKRRLAIARFGGGARGRAAAAWREDDASLRVATPHR